MGLNSGYLQARPRKPLRPSVRTIRRLQGCHADLHTNTMCAGSRHVLFVSRWCAYRRRDAEHRAPHAGMWRMPRRVFVTCKEPAAGRFAWPQSGAFRACLALENRALTRIATRALVRVAFIAMADGDAEFHAACHRRPLQRAALLRDTDRLRSAAGERLCPEHRRSDHALHAGAAAHGTERDAAWSSY